MARGYEGAFGRKLNAPWVWIPLCVLFLAPFVDPRRPFRLLHLDLLVLLGFGASHVFFNRARSALSVPLVYPVLLYLLVRLVWPAFRPRERPRAPVPVCPDGLGRAGAGAARGLPRGPERDRLERDRRRLRGRDRRRPDRGRRRRCTAPGSARTWSAGTPTGPSNYLLYVPFEQASPWSGSWDDLPAAHGAALAFDLFTLGGLVLLGSRLRPGPAGRELGVALGVAWAAYPYALFALETNSNDTLVALFTVVALLALTLSPRAVGGRPRGRRWRWAPPPSSPRSPSRRCCPPGRAVDACVTERSSRAAGPAGAGRGVPAVRARWGAARGLRPHRRLSGLAPVAVQRLGTGGLARLAADRGQGGRRRAGPGGGLRSAAARRRPGGGARRPR